MHIDISYQVSLSDAQIIRIKGHRDLGGASLVQMGCIQVGVPKVEIELVQGILRILRQVEQSLKDKVHIRVCTDDASVECVI